MSTVQGTALMRTISLFLSLTSALTLTHSQLHLIGCFFFPVPCVPYPSSLWRRRSASLQEHRSSRLTCFTDFRLANRVRTHHSPSGTARIRRPLNGPGVKYRFVTDICGAVKLVCFTLMGYFCCL